MSGILTAIPTAAAATQKAVLLKSLVLLSLLIFPE
jgi:hypothetical protein